MTLRHTLIAIAWLFAAATAPAQVPPATPANRTILTQDDFRKVLCANRWTWEFFGKKPEYLSFAPNGKVQNPYWTAKYSIEGIDTVVITSGKAKARIKFAPDYKSYSGMNFGDVIKVWGKPLQ